MKMLIGTNTKMNLTATETAAYCDVLRTTVASLEYCEIFVLPPYTSIWAARDRLVGSNIAWGAQDVHPSEEGAHTGEISAPMLADLDCRYVAVGHSERRRQYGETDELVAAKTVQVLRHGMTPIVCVGEHSIGAIPVAAESVAHQVSIAVRDVPPAQVDRVIIAYEPEWAIGAGAQPAEPGHVDAVHRAITKVLESKAGGPLAGQVIYGGSVDLASAPSLLERNSVAGLFVGRFALDPEAFATVIRMVERIAQSRTAEARHEPLP